MTQTIEVRYAIECDAETAAKWDFELVNCVEQGERFWSPNGGRVVEATAPLYGLFAKAKPRWRFPSDKLPGAVCITRDEVNGWSVWGAMPRQHGRMWVVSVDAAVLSVPSQIAEMLGITLPTPTGDPAKDIWLNPEHPANKE